MKVWYELYGKRSDDFIAGVIAALEMYAYWKDGIQYVGSTGTTLKDAVREAISELREEIE